MTDHVLTLEQIRLHDGSETDSPTTKEQALREAADILESVGAVTPEYYEAMLQREEAVSTYMGNGLVVPHGTNQTEGAILRSAISVVRYREGIPWGLHRVHWVVAIASLGDEHLELLSRVALLFSDLDGIELLEAAATPGDVLARLNSAGIR